MNERKATKRALLTSITALVMCVVMLVGTTFAWFTDTAKTNVNTIKAGKLDVQLMMKDNSGRWADAEGETLNWVKATDAPADQAILWEPGAEYKLPDLKVVNGGNLKLKYKIVITGASGDVDLLNVIDFSASITGPDGTVSSNVNVRDNNPVVYDRVLKPNEEDVIALSGKMQTSANNTYMSKTISGISITVYAAQATGEYDSISNQYDAAAAYPTVAPVLNLNTKQSVTQTSNGLSATTITESGAVSTIPAGTTMQSGNDVIRGTEGTLERVIKTTIATDPATGVDTATYDISYNFTQNGTTTEVTEFSAIVTNVLQLASGLEDVAVTHTHGSTTMQMTPAQTEDANTDGQFYYNKTTGKLTIWSKQYSAFAVSYKANFAAVVNGQFFNTLSDAVAAAKNGDTITLLRDSTENGVAVEKKGFVLDFNGHTLKIGDPLVGSIGTETNGFQLLKSAGNVTFKNGTLTTEEAYILIQNYCNLTLDNMVLDGRNIPLHAQYPNRVVRYTLSNNCGEVTIDNSVIYAPEKLGVAFDVCRYSEYPAVSVTVTGDSVINGDVEVSGKIGAGQSRQLTINGGKFYGKFKVADEPANITINGGEFVDLANAVKYAADGATIKLAGDAKGDIVIPAGKTIALDLGGHKLTNVSGDTITNEGTLTITGTGTVDNVTHGKAALVNYGTATLNGGNFTRSKENAENNKNHSGGNSYYTILNDKGATMTISEGVTVSNVGHYSSMIRNGGDNDIVSTMTINGGTFSGGINTVKNDVNGNLTINGGDFSNTSQFVIMNWNKATISGGTFEANASAEAVLFVAKIEENLAVGELKIEGGRYVCAKSQKLIIDYYNDNKGNHYPGTAVISGGTFSSDPSTYVNTETHDVTQNGSTWTVTAKPNA